MQLGSALVELLAEGVVKRDELFVTSKLWNSNHAATAVRPALEKTLADLGVSGLEVRGDAASWEKGAGWIMGVCSVYSSWGLAHVLLAG